MLKLFCFWLCCCCISWRSLFDFSNASCDVIEFIRQVERDCEFLEAERIMDYSLLVGLHFRDNTTGDKMGLSPFVLRTGKDKPSAIF